VSDDIPLLFADADGSHAGQAGRDTAGNKVTHVVQDFYEAAPFPNYNSFDSVAALVRRADTGIFARLLRDQMPLSVNVLEVGCGTGQLSNYLAATTLSRIYATDITLASLRLGRDFAKQNSIKGIQFIQMNLFMPAIRPHSMDVVISNGVLHHTHDTRKALDSISQLVKPGGHIILGLYNRIGRLRTNVRRRLRRVFGDRILVLDPRLRKGLSPERRRAWMRDQYFHPHERKHSISEVIRWFEETGFSFVSSIRKIVGTFSEGEQIFQPQSPGSRLDRILVEIGMLFSDLGAGGGLFVCVGKAPDVTRGSASRFQVNRSDHQSLEK
jgi:2-polyprenyl-3-methyl-5-hydroxy-6-metoxy-1,4-benzoquinol methylase